MLRLPKIGEVKVAWSRELPSDPSSVTIIRDAAERAVTPSALALGWLLAQPTVTSVIAGVTVPEQLDENLTASRWVPTPAEELELRELFTGDLSGGPGVVDKG